MHLTTSVKNSEAECTENYTAGKEIHKQNGNKNRGQKRGDMRGGGCK